MIILKFLVSLLVTFGAIGAYAQNTCDIALYTEAEAKELYLHLKRNDSKSLTLETDRERGMLIHHLRNLAQGRPLLIFTDASYSQASGVVTMMKVLQEIESRFGIKVRIVVPEDFKRVLKTSYQNLVFAFPREQEVLNILEQENPFAVHIMVEGTLGRKVKSVLSKKGLPYTTAYHTDFPKYLASMVPIPVFKDVLSRVAYRVLRQFHRSSQGIMVPTDTMMKGLEENGFADLETRKWSHGVDLVKFSPDLRDEHIYAGLQRPISLFVGRVAPEKNIETFLRMKNPGTKVVVGDGPQLESFRKKYPDVVFLGRRPHAEVPKYFASADVFVFPSLTDTFGLVLLEAAASGTPVLAFDWQGPRDAITSPLAGHLVEHHLKDSEADIKNLEKGFEKALSLDRQEVRNYAENHSWEISLLEFLYFLSPIPEAGR
ncbi:MAG: glycosyltransferase family 1 protein [Bdellovibrio sp.]